MKIYMYKISYKIYKTIQAYCIIFMYFLGKQIAANPTRKEPLVWKWQPLNACFVLMYK